METDNLRSEAFLKNLSTDADTIVLSGCKKMSGQPSSIMVNVVSRTILNRSVRPL